MEHHPPHLFLHNTWYVLSAATFDHVRLLANDGTKALLRDAIRTLVPEFGAILLAWVILDNHYHLLLKVQDGRELPRFLARLHGRTARQINLRDGTAGRQVWHNYWDSCVRTERDLWTRFNYIHHNPVKHGYVRHPGDWPYSSYGFHLRTRGEEWLADCWANHPAIDYMDGD